MRITITVRGEPDVMPYTKNFQFDGPDDAAFLAACDRVGCMLGRRQRINVNDALLLFSAFVVSSLREGKDGGRIGREAASILSPGQVMIGVPEMLQGLDFEVVMAGERFTVSLSRPIPATHGESPLDGGGAW